MSNRDTHNGFCQKFALANRSSEESNAPFVFEKDLEDGYRNESLRICPLGQLRAFSETESAEDLPRDVQHVFCGTKLSLEDLVNGKGIPR